jgi:hypothetical protein
MARTLLDAKEQRLKSEALLRDDEQNLVKKADRVTQAQREVDKLLSAHEQQCSLLKVITVIESAFWQNLCSRFHWSIAAFIELICSYDRWSEIPSCSRLRPLMPRLRVYSTKSNF